MLGTEAANRIESRPALADRVFRVGSELSLARRLGLGFGFVVVLMLAALGNYLVGQEQQSRTFNYLTQQVMPRARAAQDIASAYLRQSAAARSFAYSGDQRYLAEYQESEILARDASAWLDRLPKAPEEQALFAEMRLLAARFGDASERAIQARQAGNDGEARRVVEEEMIPTRSELVGKTDAYVALQVREQEAAQAEVARVLASTERDSSVLALVALICAVAAATLTTWSVIHPVRRLVEASRALGQGDHERARELAVTVNGDRRVSRPRRDELRVLGNTFLGMIEDIQRRERRRQTTLRLTAALASTIDAEKLSRVALGEIAEYAEVQFGAIYALANRDEAALRLVGSYALGGAPDRIALGEGVPGEAAASLRRVIVRGIAEDLPFQVRFGFDQVPPRTVVAEPLIVGERLVGTLLVGSIHDLSEESLDFIASSAKLLAVSLQNALAHERVQELAGRLREGNEHLQAQNEEIQAQSEELQAQNEEIQAQNEELMAANQSLAEQTATLQEQARLLDLAHILVRDADDRIVAWNGGAEALYGFSSDEAIGQVSHDLLQTAYPISREALAEGLERDGFWQGELVHVARDGRRVIVASHQIVRRDGESRPRVLEVDNDITERRRAEEALRLSEERYRSLFSGMSEGSVLYEIVCDESDEPIDFRFLDVNPAYERLSGLRREDLVGRSFREVFPSDDPSLARIYGAVALSGEPTRFGRYSPPLGRYIDVLAYSPAPRQVAVVIFDVTERRLAEETLRQRAEEIETLMDLVPAAIWVSHDPGCHEIVGNRTANQFYEAMEGENVSAGPEPGRTVGPRRFFGDGRELRADELPMQVAVARNAEVRDAEFDVILPSGQTRALLGSATPLRDAAGRVRGCVAAFVDVTERKRAAAERERLLSSEQQARSAAELAVRERDDFLSVAAHELKTPVTSLRGYAQTLLRQLDRVDALDPARVRAAMSQIDRQSARLSNLMNQLLDLTRIEAGRLALSRQLADVSAVVEGSVESLRRVHPERDLVLATPGPLTASIDPPRLEQIITNLADNAIKFSPEGSPVEITVESPSRDAVRIVVRDHGIGIPETKRAQIFERFYQAHDGNRRGGMGLGLFISQQIAELHGGRISVECPADGGSAFALFLPNPGATDDMGAGDEQ